MYIIFNVYGIWIYKCISNAMIKVNRTFYVKSAHDISQLFLPSGAVAKKHIRIYTWTITCRAIFSICELYFYFPDMFEHFQCTLYLRLVYTFFWTFLEFLVFLEYLTSRAFYEISICDISCSSYGDSLKRPYLHLSVSYYVSSISCIRALHFRYLDILQSFQFLPSTLQIVYSTRGVLRAFFIFF